METRIWKDVRLLGALTALGLDGLWLALSVLLAAASVWFVAFPLFGSLTGLVVAPLAGWRYGRPASSGQPIETWAVRALGFAVAIGLALWSAYIVGCIVLLGVPGGSTNLAPFVGFAAFESSVYVLLDTVFVTIPIGCLWLTLLRLNRPRAGPPASALWHLSDAGPSRERRRHARAATAAGERPGCSRQGP